MGSRGPAEIRVHIFLFEEQVTSSQPSFYDSMFEGSLTKIESSQRRPRIDLGSVFKLPLSETKFRSIWAGGGVLVAAKGCFGAAGGRAGAGRALTTVNDR